MRTTVSSLALILGFLSSAASAQVALSPVHSGTGFFITPEYIVTNAHVVNGCRNVSIKGAVPAQMAKVETFDADRDLAVIKTSENDHQVAPVRYGIDLHAGDKAYVIGYPGMEGAQGKYKFIEAYVRAAAPGFPVGGGRFYITDNIEHGDSGGPVFDNFGNIIGVVVATTDVTLVNKKTGAKLSEQKLGTVINLDTVNEFLKAQNIYTDWVGSGSGKVDSHIEENAKAFIVNVQCNSSIGY